MRRFALLVAVFAQFAHALGAQEVRQQGTTLTLPTFTDSQLWDGLTGNFNAFFTAGISQAKSLGKTAEYFGHSTGNLFAPGWGPPKSGTAIGYAREMAFNFAGYPGAAVQVTATSDSSATLRFRRTYLTFFGPSRTVFGVTSDEYERAMKEILATIADYLGLRTSIQFDGEWATVGVAGRGSAAPSSVFPTGTFTASFSDSTVRAHPNLAGAWEVTYAPNRHYVLRHNESPFVEGDYEVTLDQMVIPHADTGAPGVIGCTTPAVYRWMVDPKTRAISFERLADDCMPRVDFLTNAKLTKK